MDAERKESGIQLWVNARLWNEHGDFHEALCIRDGRILALGTEGEMRQRASAFGAATEACWMLPSRIARCT